MAVTFHFEEISKFPFKVNSHKTWISNIIKSYDRKVGDISFIFCSDEYLLKINQQYLNHDYFTDVITFDYCEDKIVSGDIFISIDRIKENAKLQNVLYVVELQRIIIHGILHLLGFQDNSPVLKSRMTEAENSALESLYTVK